MRPAIQYQCKAYIRNENDGKKRDRGDEPDNEVTNVFVANVIAHTVPNPMCVSVAKVEKARPGDVSLSVLGMLGNRGRAYIPVVVTSRMMGTTMTRQSFCHML
jgi:hypothetical protein